MTFAWAGDPNRSGGQDHSSLIRRYLCGEAGPNLDQPFPVPKRPIEPDQLAPSPGLDALGTKSEPQGMDNRDCLAYYAFVVVRIACRVCSRRGSYRLARLAAKFGPEISLRDLMDRFTYDCLWRAEARSKKGKSACGVYLPDLEQPRPPDVPPGMVKLRLVKKA
jgi:hypothetical protein